MNYIDSKFLNYGNKIIQSNLNQDTIYKRQQHSFNIINFSHNNNSEKGLH